MFQPLESRRLLSTLRLTGTAGNDSIELRELTTSPRTGSTFLILNQGSTAITAAVDATSIVIAAYKSILTTQIKVGSLITEIPSVSLQGGNDRFVPTVTFSVPSTITGGDGNDSITAGNQQDYIDAGTGNDTVFGGASYDTIYGAAGADSLNGGADQDIVDGGDDNDTLLGGIGFDSLTGDAGNDRILGNGTAATATEQYDTLDGGIGDDSLQSDNSIPRYSFEDSAFASSLVGGDGNDTLQAGNGGDELHGGNGNDSIVGGSGNDALDGGDGDDALVGGKGNDTYQFYTAADFAETDTLSEKPNEGTDLIAFDGAPYLDSIGFPRTDFVMPSTLGVRVDLADAANFLSQGLRRAVTPTGLQNNFENVQGGLGPDTLFGNAANNLLSAGVTASRAYDLDDLSADRVDGAGGNDTLIGISGSDTYVGVGGIDSLYGGDGNDDFETYNQIDGEAVFVSAGAGIDTLTVKEDPFDDHTVNMPGDLEDLTFDANSHVTVNGNALNNIITVNSAFNGTFNGGDGNDTLIGNTAAGTLSGGAGNDTLTMTVPLAAVLRGGDGNDLMTGVGTVDTDGTNYSPQYLSGGAGRDTLQATSGTVWADYSTATGPLRIDFSSGTYTGSGGDIDILGTGVTQVRGTPFNDTITGDARDNVFDGGGGDDELSGGAGIDTAWYADRAAGVSIHIDGKRDSGTAGEHDLIQTDIERLVGTAGEDTLTGSDANNTLQGLAGDDSCDGGAGDDLLYGGSTNDGIENDTLVGGTGNDTADFSSVQIVDANAVFNNFATAGKRHPADNVPSYQIAGITLDGIANDGAYDLFGDQYSYYSDYVPSSGIHGNVMTENVNGAGVVIGDNNPNRFTDVLRYASGGGGNDTLTAHGDDGALNGDYFSEDNDTADLDGGAGADVITGGFADYTSRTKGVAISLNGLADDGEPGEHDNVTANFYGILIGGKGNDTLTGDGNANEIMGLAGNDVLSGNGGNDVLAGGFSLGQNTADQFNESTFLRALIAASTGADGNDTFNGGDGTDTIDYGLRHDKLVLTLDGKANDGAAGELDNTGTGADVEYVVGGQGNDSMTAGAYGSNFIGGPGADTFVGGAGVDRVLYKDRAAGVSVSLNDKSDDGEPGEKDDVASSIDQVVGTLYADKLIAGARPANLDGYATYDGIDTLTGGVGADVLTSGGHSLLTGGSGDDIFVNQNGSVDTIDGGDGFDSIQEDSAYDPNNDDLVEDISSDVEYVYDTLGDDTPAADTAAAVRTPAATTTVTISGVSVGVDAKNVLRITGSATADTIELDQSAGNVTVYVGSKSAGVFAVSSLKTITIDAAAGNDTVRLSTAAGKTPLQVGVRVHGGDGSDTLNGGDGGDQLAGEGGNDSVNGGGGNDVLSGDFIVFKGEAVPAAALVPDGSDILVGGGGDSDLLSYTNRTAPVAINMIAGTVVSGSEKDKISSVEILVGGQAGDVIAGGPASDALFAGPGNDTLSGGAGADQLRAGTGVDSINPDAGGDFVDSGPDNDIDRIVGSLTADSGGILDLPYGVDHSVLFGSFNAKDYFTVSGHYFHDKA